MSISISLSVEAFSTKSLKDYNYKKNLFYMSTLSTSTCHPKIDLNPSFFCLVSEPAEENLREGQDHGLDRADHRPWAERELSTLLPVLPQV